MVTPATVCIHTHTHALTNTHTNGGIYSLVIKKTKEVSVRQLGSVKRELILVFKARRQKEALQMNRFTSYAQTLRSCATLFTHPSTFSTTGSCVRVVLPSFAYVAVVCYQHQSGFSPPPQFLFHFYKSFDFHVDGAELITAGNCPGEMRQRDKIRQILIQKKTTQTKGRVVTSRFG